MDHQSTFTPLPSTSEANKRVWLFLSGLPEFGSENLFNCGKMQPIAVFRVEMMHTQDVFSHWSEKPAKLNTEFIVFLQWCWYWTALDSVCHKSQMSRSWRFSLDFHCMVHPYNQWNCRTSLGIFSSKVFIGAQIHTNLCVWLVCI